jgi:hypothetical protein
MGDYLISLDIISLQQEENKISEKFRIKDLKWKVIIHLFKFPTSLIYGRDPMETRWIQIDIIPWKSNFPQKFQIHYFGGQSVIYFHIFIDGHMWLFFQ